MARTKGKNNAQKKNKSIVKAKQSINKGGAASKSIESIFGPPKKAWKRVSTPQRNNSNNNNYNNNSGSSSSKKKKKNGPMTPSTPASSSSSSKKKTKNKQQQQVTPSSSSKVLFSNGKKNHNNNSSSGSINRLKQQQQLKQALEKKQNRMLELKQAAAQQQQKSRTTPPSKTSSAKKNGKKTIKSAPKVNNAVRKFQMKLPDVGPNATPAPWWVNNNNNSKTKGSPASLSSSKTQRMNSNNNQQQQQNDASYKILGSITVKEESLRLLNEELVAFADYVRLKPPELHARYHLIETIQQLAKSLFDVDPSHCQVFGSFAAQDVCSFESDIDLAIWGVVDVDDDKVGGGGGGGGNDDNDDNDDDDYDNGDDDDDGNDDDDDDDDKNSNNVNDASASAAESKPPPIVHPNQRKQAKILKWKAALDELYNNTSNNNNKDDENDKNVSDEENAIDNNNNLKEGKTQVDMENEAEESNGDDDDIIIIEEKQNEKESEAIFEDPEEDVLPLFVIDRVGIPCKESKPELVDMTVTPEMTPTTNVFNNENDATKSVPAIVKNVDGQSPSQEVLEDVDKKKVSEITESVHIQSPSQFDDADAEAEAPVDVEEPDVMTETLNAESMPDLESTSASGENEQFEDSPEDKTLPVGDVFKQGDSDSDDKKSSTGSDSDNDSADKLEGLKQQRSRAFSCDSETRLLNLPDADDLYHPSDFTASRGDDQPADDDNDEDEEEMEISGKPRSHSIVSLSSSTSGSERGEWDSSGMEVSFVTMPTAARPRSHSKSFGPEGDIRVLIVRKLNLLQKRLRRTGMIEQSHVRKHARVPIINMVTRFGYECDIALGGHNGTDTSAYAVNQIARFKSFATVVLFLKVLLCQNDLDKPFSGGLGSFKLYVLVANHIERHLALGGSDNPGEILLMFLFRYGDIASFGNVDKNARTELSQFIVIESGNGTADMGSVYQVQNCVKVFEACWNRLQSKLKRNFNPEHSFLRYMVDPVTLDSRRRKCYAGASLLYRFAPSYRITMTTPTMPLGKQQLSRALSQQKKMTPSTPPARAAVSSSANEEFEDLSTDEEAEQLKAGYGMSTTRLETTEKQKKRKRSKSKDSKSRRKLNEKKKALKMRR